MESENQIKMDRYLYLGKMFFFIKVTISRKIGSICEFGIVLSRRLKVCSIIYLSYTSNHFHNFVKSIFISSQSGILFQNLKILTSSTCDQLQLHLKFSIPKSTINWATIQNIENALRELDWKLNIAAV